PADRQLAWSGDAALVAVPLALRGLMKDSRLCIAAHPVVLAALVLSGACQGEGSTLSVQVSAQPSDLPIVTVALEIRQSSKPIIERDFPWGPGATVEISLPADVSGLV